jgi:hypothetical protein
MWGIGIIITFIIILAAVTILEPKEVTSNLTAAIMMVMSFIIPGIIIYLWLKYED